MSAEFVAAAFISMALIAFGAIEYKQMKRRAKRRSPEIVKSMVGGRQ